MFHKRAGRFLLPYVAYEGGRDMAILVRPEENSRR